jgi:hypothetical protein
VAAGFTQPVTGMSTGRFLEVKSDRRVGLTTPQHRVAASTSHRPIGLRSFALSAGELRHLIPGVRNPV